MYKEYTYKKQGNGLDSWVITEWDSEEKNEMLNRYVVYEDPEASEPKIDISNVDLSSMTPAQVIELKSILGI